MQLGKPSKLPPRTPCFAIFNGARHIRGPIYEHICEPLEVREVVNGKGKELAVAMTGRASCFPIGNFQGEWIVLELENAQ